MVLKESLLLAAGGIGAGRPLAVATSRLLRTMLFGVAPVDVLTFSAALRAVTLSH